MKCQKSKILARYSLRITHGIINYWSMSKNRQIRWALSLVHSNAGHGYYAHKMLEKAPSHGQPELNSIGQLLGPGPNSFQGVSSKAPYGSAFKEHNIRNGVLYLGDEPYL
jgi:hypothetical protein